MRLRGSTLTLPRRPAHLIRGRGRGRGRGRVRVRVRVRGRVGVRVRAWGRVVARHAVIHGPAPLTPTLT